MATHQPGLEALYDELRELGYDAAVFDFNFITKEGEEIHAAPHRGRVIITCTENNMHKTYVAVDGAWRAQFCQDVRDGMFGPPPKGVPFDEERAHELAQRDQRAGAETAPGRLWK